ncbi:hypothetical protein PR048_027960 [Dryococelus australis]|uniref:Uncharacterized protein n=1 Tax=Dryococelus australis TaxID=614101 RepID=A0ABQ9GHX0_9NEOP|nr:hypothetical protein PR048_027960 [Dryococelus australis]
MERHWNARAGETGVHLDNEEVLFLFIEDTTMVLPGSGACKKINIHVRGGTSVSLVNRRIKHDLSAPDIDTDKYVNCAVCCFLINQGLSHKEDIFVRVYKFYEELLQYFVDYKEKYRAFMTAQVNTCANIKRFQETDFAIVRGSTYARCGAVVAQRLERSPSANVNRARFPGGVTLGFPYMGIVPGGVSSRRVFSGISRFRHPCISALLHTHLASSSSDPGVNSRPNLSTAPLRVALQTEPHRRRNLCKEAFIAAERARAAMTAIGGMTASRSEVSLMANLNKLETLETSNLVRRSKGKCAECLTTGIRRGAAVDAVQAGRTAVGVVDERAVDARAVVVAAATIVVADVAFDVVEVEISAVDVVVVAIVVVVEAVVMVVLEVVVDVQQLTTNTRGGVELEAAAAAAGARETYVERLTADRRGALEVAAVAAVEAGGAALDVARRRGVHAHVKPELVQAAVVVAAVVVDVDVVEVDVDVVDEVQLTLAVVQRPVSIPLNAEVRMGGGGMINHFPVYVPGGSCDCPVVRLLAAHLGEPGSIPGEAAPGASHVGIMPDDYAGRRVFSGICRFPRPCIAALLHTHLAHPQDIDVIEPAKSLLFDCTTDLEVPGQVRAGGRGDAQVVLAAVSRVGVAAGRGAGVRRRRRRGGGSRGGGGGGRGAGDGARGAQAGGAVELGAARACVEVGGVASGGRVGDAQVVLTAAGCGEPTGRRAGVGLATAHARLGENNSRLFTIMTPLVLQDHLVPGYVSTGLGMVCYPAPYLPIKIVANYSRNHEHFDLKVADVPSGTTTEVLKKT